MARTPSSTSTLTSPAPGSDWSFVSDGFVAGDHDLPSMQDGKCRATRVAPAQSSFSVPDTNEDPLVVRGITWDMDAESLSDLNHIDDTVLGPVWAAKLDGTTPVRVFGLRPTGAARLNKMLDSLHNILREQVLFSRARLARLVGVVLRLVAVGGRDRGGEWVGLVYQCSEADLIGAAPLPVEAEGVSAATPIAGGSSCSQTSDDSSDSDDGTFPPPGSVVPQQVIEMVETMLAASRILRSSIFTTGVVAFHPAFFINDGTEVACWGLIGGVAWLWLDADHPLAAPEISDVVLPPPPPPPPPPRPTPAPLSPPVSPPTPPPSRPTSALPATTAVAAQVFALMRFASDLLTASVGSPNRKFAANIRNLLVAGVADDPGDRPSLVEAVYGVLAELVEPERGWSWVHYACKCNDSGAVAAFVAGGGDVNLRALAVDRDHESSLSLMDVACLHGSVDCVSSLLSLGCRLSSKALVLAIHGGNVDVVDLLTPAYTAVETAHFPAVAPDDVAVFDALLCHLPDAQLDAVFNCCCATLSLRNAACFALLARRGLSLEPPTNATRDLRDELAAAADLVPFGCHPLDCMGRAEGIATTSAGDAGSGHHNVSVRSRRRPTATAAGTTLIEVPGWVRVFPRNEFQLADRIGRGAFGEVYRATRREGEAAVAVKMLVSQAINRRVARAFLSEVAAHVRIHHARVLLMHGLVVDDQQSGAMGLVSEYMAGGSLSARLKAARRDGRVADEFHAGLRARVLLQAAEGISYLHSQRLIHRDIKPANIFLTASGEAKVGDLGFASMAGGREGWTRAYAAPELLLDKVPRSSVASDVYAFAVTVYETLSLAVIPRGSRRKDGLEYELPWVIAGLRRPTGWWAVVVTRVLGALPANRPSMDALQVPLEALEATREANAGAFFGLVALERWAEALEVVPVDDPAEAVVAGAHTTALWRAVKARAPVRVLAACVARGCEVDARNDREETPLMWATTAPVVAALLAAGANVEACDEFGRTPLMHASSAGRRQVVMALLEGGARVSAVDDDGWDAMFHASATGNAGIMVVLTTAGALVRTVDLEGRTLLMQAAKSGDRKCVNVLLSAVWDVNVTSRDGRSALLHGAVAGGVGVVKALLLAGSNVNLADQDGRTALMHAAREGHVRVVGELLEASAAVDVLDHGEMSALNHAASMGRVGVIGALAAASVLRTDARDTDGRTALMRAATHGHVDGCRYLASAGADLEAANADGRTPLMLAASSGHAEAVAVLLDAGAKVEARDCGRATALMLAAAAEGNGEVVSVLLEAGGANVAAADNNGLSAAFYACAAGDGNAEVVAALVSAGADLDQQLVRAVARGANEAALRLLAAGASVGAAQNVDGLGGLCALAHAVTAGGPDLIRALIEAGADVDAVCGDNGPTVLSRAVLACNTAAVRVLLKDGQADPNARDGNGATALAHAASLGRPVETRLLLAAGAEPNARDSVLGRTPLMRACARGNVDVVVALLASDGISVDGAVDSDGWTALMHAAARGNDGAVTALVAAGAGVNCADSYRQTPTMVGIAHVAVVRILVEAGADVNTADASGQTALMMAAARGGDHMLGVVEALLAAAGAVAQAADADGRSALAIALGADHADIARVLQRRVVL